MNDWPFEGLPAVIDRRPEHCEPAPLQAACNGRCGAVINILVGDHVRIVALALAGVVVACLSVGLHECRFLVMLDGPGCDAAIEAGEFELELIA